MVGKIENRGGECMGDGGRRDVEGKVWEVERGAWNRRGKYGTRPQIFEAKPSSVDGPKV